MFGRLSNPILMLILRLRSKRWLRPIGPRRAVAIFVLLLASSAGGRGGDDLRGQISALIRASGAEKVAVAFHDLETERELLIDADESFHAASTMKVPVMMEVFRQAQAGRLALDERLKVKTNSRASPTVARIRFLRKMIPNGRSTAELEARRRCASWSA